MTNTTRAEEIKKRIEPEPINVLMGQVLDVDKLAQYLCELEERFPKPAGDNFWEDKVKEEIARHNYLRALEDVRNYVNTKMPLSSVKDLVAQVRVDDVTALLDELKKRM